MTVVERRREPGSIDRLSASVPDVFRLVLEQFATALCLVDLEGRFLTVNPAACALFGRSREDLLSTTWHELTHPDDLDADLAMMRRVVSGELDTYRLAKRYVQPDGVVVHGHLTVTGVRDPAGGLVCFASQILDVTGATLSQEAARIAQAQLRGVIDSQLDPWVLMTAVRDGSGTICDFRYRDANAAACTANGLEREVLLQRTLLELFPEHEESGLLAMYAHVVTTGEPLALDDYPFLLPDSDGRPATRWFDNRVTRVDDGVSFTWRDVTERVRHRQRLAEGAFRDPLTGLANRARLEGTLDQLRGPRPSEGLVAVLYCDLDGLKPINDTLGHEAGDIVLMAVASRIREAVRMRDLVARVGGDEFVVVLDDLGSASDARLLVEKIGRAVSRPVTIRGIDIVPSISIGVALAEEDEDPAVTLRRADAALYRSKARRRT